MSAPLHIAPSICHPHIAHHPHIPSSPHPVFPTSIRHEIPGRAGHCIGCIFLGVCSHTVARWASSRQAGGKIRPRHGCVYMVGMYISNTCGSHCGFWCAVGCTCGAGVGRGGCISCCAYTYWYDVGVLLGGWVGGGAVWVIRMCWWWSIDKHVGYLSSVDFLFMRMLTTMLTVLLLLRACSQTYTPHHTLTTPTTHIHPPPRTYTHHHTQPGVSQYATNQPQLLSSLVPPTSALPLHLVWRPPSSPPHHGSGFSTCLGDQRWCGCPCGWCCSCQRGGDMVVVDNRWGI